MGADWQRPEALGGGERRCHQICHWLQVCVVPDSAVPACFCSTSLTSGGIQITGLVILYMLCHRLCHAPNLEVNYTLQWNHMTDTPRGAIVQRDAAKTIN